MKQLDLLVVVPAYNESKFIGDCLSSITNALAAQSVHYRVIVVDNGSTDDTGKLAAQYGATVLRLERSSVSCARNEGARNQAGTLIAFIDADVIVTPQWGEAVRRLLTTKEQGHLLTGHQYSIRDNAGWIERFWFENIKDKHLNGGNIIVSRSAFELIGGFDENLKTGEDYDFCVRAQSLGVVYSTDERFRAIHLGYPRTLLAFVRREIWHGEGDFQSLGTFIRSPVAILGIGYFLVTLIICLFLVAGKHLLAVTVMVILIAGNTLLTKLRFPRCDRNTLAVNSIINFIYFIARALSLGRTLVNIKKRY